MKTVTPKNLRSVFPKQVPKDIVTLVDECMFNGIREAIRKTIYKHITLVISPEFIPEEYFLEKVTQGFVEKIGNCFKEFLENYESVIKNKGSDVIYDICDVVLLSFCLNIDYEYLFKDLTHISNVFIQIILTRMGKGEGYFDKEGDTGILFTYLDSLKS
jgi:hypothetical protein